MRRAGHPHARPDGRRTEGAATVAGTPALGWVAQECAPSGIDEPLVVIAPGKEAIVDYLEPIGGTDGTDGTDGRDGMPRRIGFVVQPEARGLADAIGPG